MFNSMFVHRQQHHNLVNGPGIWTLGGLDNHDLYYTIWANMNLSYSCQRPFRWNQIVFLHKYDVPDVNIPVSTMPFIAFPEGHKVFSGPPLPKVTHQSLNQVPTS